MKNISKYEYVIQNNTVVAKGHEDSIAVYDLSSWYPERINYLRSLMAHRRDLDYAKAFLEQMFFDSGTTLIDGALINSAIQLLVKCFSSQNGDGRKPLDCVKVFRKYANSIGEEDFSKQFSQFYDARNQVIAHDQYIFKENIVGLAVNVNNNYAEEITEITIRAGYLYLENQQLLLRLVNIAHNYIENQINNSVKEFIKNFNEADPKPQLKTVKCENMAMATSW